MELSGPLWALPAGAPGESLRDRYLAVWRAGLGVQPLEDRFVVGHQQAGGDRLAGRGVGHHQIGGQAAHDEQPATVQAPVRVRFARLRVAVVANRDADPCSVVDQPTVAVRVFGQSATTLASSSSTTRQVSAASSVSPSLTWPRLLVRLL